MSADDVWHVCAYPLDLPLLVERSALDRDISLGDHAVLELPRRGDPDRYRAPRRAGNFDMNHLLVDGSWALDSNDGSVAVHGVVVALALDPSALSEAFDPAVHGLTGFEQW